MPGNGTTAPPPWIDSQDGTQTGQPRLLTVESALREVRAALDDAGLHISHSKAVRLVRAYIAGRDADQSFGDWVIAYADPTGETAIRNILRGARC